MSTDPSPWGEAVTEPDFIEPTAQMVERENEERIQQDHEQQRSLRLWNTFAARIAADGTLIR